MIEYKNRTYREHLQKERWYSFTVAYKETDLWIGIDQASFQESIPTFTESRIRTLREYMDAYLQNDPDYATSLVPYETQPGAPTIFQEMSEVARKSGIGPMSAVAVAVASRIGQEIKEKYGIPCFTKNQDEYIKRYQKGNRSEHTMSRILGTSPSKHNLNKKARELTLSGAAHKISNECCIQTKENTLSIYEKESGKRAIIGVRTAESFN